MLNEFYYFELYFLVNELCSAQNGHFGVSNFFGMGQKFDGQEFGLIVAVIGRFNVVDFGREEVVLHHHKRTAGVGMSLLANAFNFSEFALAGNANV